MMVVLNMVLHWLNHGGADPCTEMQAPVSGQGRVPHIGPHGEKCHGHIPSSVHLALPERIYKRGCWGVFAGKVVVGVLALRELRPYQWMLSFFLRAMVE